LAKVGYKATGFISSAWCYYVEQNGLLY